MRLFSLLFTVFLDYLGFGLVFPFFFPMIMEPSHGFMAQDASVELRGLVAGMLVASYSVAQFFALPLQGAYSDRLGRKKVLNLSLWIITFGYLVATIGILLQSIPLLLLSRMIAGFGTGNYAVIQASISDVVDQKEKTKYFGLINMACGSGFIIGPFIGGNLADFSFFGLSNFATPFMIAFILAFINALLIARYFNETLLEFKKEAISFFKSVTNFRKAFTTSNLKPIFWMIFVFSFGWGFMVEFMPFFLMNLLNFGPKEIGYFYAYIGALVALFQGFGIRIFVNRMAPKTLLSLGLFSLGLTVPFLFLADSTLMLAWLLVPAIFFEALIYPSISTIVSDLSGKDEQGENLGINQSLQAAAFALAPLFSGSIVAKHPTLPLWVATAGAFAAFFILYLSKPLTKLLTQEKL